MAFLTIASFFLGSSSALAISSMVGERPERLLKVRGHPSPFEQQLDHVGGNSDRLGGIDQRPLDRLLDPVAGISAEPRADGRVKTLDGPQEAEVSFFDQVLKRKSLADIAARDVHHQAQVRPHHPLARQLVAIGDAVGQLFLFVGRQQSHFVDLPEIGLQGALHSVASVSANPSHESPR